MPSPVRYCLPICRGSWSQALDTLRRSTDRFDRFELWIDRITDDTGRPLDLDGLAPLLRTGSSLEPDRLIVVWGRPSDGRPPAPLAFDPAALFPTLRQLPLTVDLDLDHQDALLVELAAPASDRPWRSIISHHDFEATPCRSELDRKVDAMVAAGADIVKIATRCRSPRDALRLLDLGLDLRDRGQSHVVVGMGPHGVATRVLGPLWSSQWAYAPEAPDAASAPGQLTRDTLARIFESLL
ncbi:MAG: type I 3-dehydroquinate dehydratase [Planctomycetes bacterium]|nr:type I 3-dehydroquinate dehydratase [Planctomycetota bacterium]